MIQAQRLTSGLTPRGILRVSGPLHERASGGQSVGCPLNHAKGEHLRTLHIFTASVSSGCRGGPPNAG
jgi:hypothetical protein